MTRLLNGLDQTAVTTANDHLMAKTMADALVAQYPPPHLWAVSADSRTGLCIVRNLLLSGNMGFVIKMPAIYSASAFKADVVRAGGELLERYRLRAGRFDEQQYADLKTDFKGEFTFDT
jgi:hypothetical protein